VINKLIKPSLKSICFSENC